MACEPRATVPAHQWDFQLSDFTHVYSIYIYTVYIYIYANIFTRPKPGLNGCPRKKALISLLDVSTHKWNDVNKFTVRIWDSFSSFCCWHPWIVHEQPWQMKGTPAIAEQLYATVAVQLAAS